MRFHTCLKSFLCIWRHNYTAVRLPILQPLGTLRTQAELFYSVVYKVAYTTVEFTHNTTEARSVIFRLTITISEILLKIICKNQVICNQGNHPPDLMIPSVRTYSSKLKPIFPCYALYFHCFIYTVRTVKSTCTLFRVL